MGLVRIRNEKGEGNHEPSISKKAMRRIVDYKDSQIRTRADHIVHLEVNERRMEAQLEKDMKCMKDQKVAINYQKEVTKYVGVAATIFGFIVGYLCG